jgi:hypothetical protein
MIEKLQAHYGFTRMPFGRDLAPGMLHRHAAHNEAVARITWCISDIGNQRYKNLLNAPACRQDAVEQVCPAGVSVRGSGTCPPFQPAFPLGSSPSVSWRDGGEPDERGHGHSCCGIEVLYGPHPVIRTEEPATALVRMRGTRRRLSTGCRTGAVVGPDSAVATAVLDRNLLRHSGTDRNGMARRLTCGQPARSRTRIYGLYLVPGYRDLLIASGIRTC